LLKPPFFLFFITVKTVFETKTYFFEQKNIEKKLKNR